MPSWSRACSAPVVAWGTAERGVVVDAGSPFGRCEAKCAAPWNGWCKLWGLVSISSKNLQWRVAVASTNGTDIDTHLGRARTVSVYEVHASGVHHLLERRTVPPQERLEFHAPETLSPFFDGLDIVLASHAGPTAVRALAQRGVKLFTIGGPIDRALTALARRGAILENMPYHGTTSGGGGCGGGGCGSESRCGEPRTANQEPDCAHGEVLGDGRT
jgi:predicted Fe-Mo cluster-binding NifX family protein